MKISKVGLGLLSEGLHPAFLRRYPVAGWIADLAVVFGTIELFYLLARWAGLFS